MGIGSGAIHMGFLSCYKMWDRVGGGMVISGRRMMPLLMRFVLCTDARLEEVTLRSIAPPVIHRIMLPRSGQPNQRMCLLLAGKLSLDPTEGHKLVIPLINV